MQVGSRYIKSMTGLDHTNTMFCVCHVCYASFFSCLDIVIVTLIVRVDISFLRLKFYYVSRFIY